MRYWLWVWLPRSKVRSGWDFGTREDAESYFNRHFRDEPVKHEIVYQEA